MERAEFIANYKNYVSLVFNEAKSRRIDVYYKMQSLNPQEILKHGISIGSEEDAVEFVRKIMKQKFSEPREEYVPEKRIVEVINGLVELSDIKGNYLR